MIKKYGPYIVLFVVVFFLINNTLRLEQENRELESKAVFYKLKAKDKLNEYNALKQKDSALELSYDSLINVKSKIKIKYNERIKIVDRYTISDMQQFFDQRTGEGCDPR